MSGPGARASKPSYLGEPTVFSAPEGHGVSPRSMDVDCTLSLGSRYFTLTGGTTPKAAGALVSERRTRCQSAVSDDGTV